MAINGIGSQSMLQVQNLVAMRHRLDDLQRQLGTGKRANDYAGIGLDRGLTIGLRTQLTTTQSFASTIDVIGTRLELCQTALTDIGEAARVVKAGLPNSSYMLDDTGQTRDQITARGQLDRILAALNTRFGDQYVFSGQSADLASTVSLDHILNGDGTRAGFSQVMEERRQADLGAGLGRLSIPAPPANIVSISEDVAGSVFGFKLVSMATDIAGAAITPPAGAPKSMSIDFTAAAVEAGDTVTCDFALPDGTSERLVLTATTASPPGDDQFTIGATPADTATNLQAALTTSVGALARTSLTAASAIAAANDFFNTNAGNPPRRITPPFATAVAQTAGTAADTVFWYSGDAGTSMPARATAVARIDTAITVSYGMRANEEGLRIPVANLAVFAAMEFSASDVDGKERYIALAQRVQGNLSSQSGIQKVSDISADLAGAQTAIGAAAERHTQTKAALTDLLQNVEGVPLEQVGAEILAMQTSLQASLQAAAMLANLSLVKFI